MLPARPLSTNSSTSRPQRREVAPDPSARQRLAACNSVDCCHFSAPQSLRPVRQTSLQRARPARVQTSALSTHSGTAERSAEAQASDADFRVLKKQATSQHQLTDKGQKDHQHHEDDRYAHLNGHPGSLLLQEEHAERVNSNHRASTTASSHNGASINSASDKGSSKASRARANSTRAHRLAEFEQVTPQVRLSKSSIDSDAELDDKKSWELVGYWRAKPADSEANRRRQPRRQQRQPTQNDTRHEHMATWTVEKDAGFKPQALMSPGQITLSLALQRLNPLSDSRQAWKTETWALLQLGSGNTRATLADGRDVTGRAVPLPRVGPFIIGSASDADCDLIIEHASTPARTVQLEMVHGGKRGRVARLTVQDLGSGKPVWVNRHRLPGSREVEALPNNVLTIADRDIAFQLVPLAGANNAAWDTRIAQRLLVNAEPHVTPADAKAVDADGWVHLGNRERLKCLHQPPGSSLRQPSCMARVYFRAAVGHLERECVAATADAAAEHKSGAGQGSYATPNAPASRTYAALGKNEGPSVELVRALGWWARHEMHLGNKESARRLWRRAIYISRKHPRGPLPGGGFSQLLSWARTEALAAELGTARWLLGEAQEMAADQSDRRLTLVTGLLQTLESQPAQPAPGIAQQQQQQQQKAKKVRRRRWASLPHHERPPKGFQGRWQPKKKAKPAKPGRNSQQAGSDMSKGMATDMWAEYKVVPNEDHSGSQDPNDDVPQREKDFGTQVLAPVPGIPGINTRFFRR